MIILFFTAIVSFLGSIQPGPLNLAVVSTSLNINEKAALILVFGGVIPELIYSGLAAEGIFFFERNQHIFNILRWLLVVILFVLSIFSFFAKEKQSRTRKYKLNKFMEGFVLSILNFQLLLFWLLVVLYYQNFDFLHIKTWSDKLFFMIGACLGAFSLNYLYAHWAFSKKSFIFKNVNKKMLNQIIGIGFLVMALFQVFIILNS